MLILLKIALAVMAPSFALTPDRDNLGENGSEAPGSFRAQVPFTVGPEEEKAEAADVFPLFPALSIDGAPPEVERPPAEDEASFSIGPEGGYLRARGTDRGTWFGGVAARLHLLRILAAEASITFHENTYNHSDVVVSQYPVQLTAFLYIIPAGPIRPYILGGVGWYYSRIDYRGAEAAIPNRTEHIFGEHLGAGAELFLAPRLSLDADVRYIFLNPTSDRVINKDFNYWQIAFGVNFYF